MSKPKYLTHAPEFGLETIQQWPPRYGFCPDCHSATVFCGESYRRYLYSCEETDCKRHQRGFWQDDKALIYARYPGLWCHMDVSFQLATAFPNSLTPIIFLCENSESLPVIGRCSYCEKLFSGLYSSVATAGFTFQTTKDVNWRKHSDDPTFNTILTCDKCIVSETLRKGL